MKTEGLDVVIPYRRSRTFDKELRYTLRSLSNLKGINKVYLIGERPEWIQNVEYIPMAQSAQKGKNTRNALILACKKVSTDNFIIMADDMYITKPMDEIKLYHGGDMQMFLNRFNARFSSSYYTHKIKDTIEFFKDEPLVHYELHVPFVVEKRLALSLLTKPTYHGLMFRSLYGNIFLDGAGEKIDDVKYYNRLKGPWFKTTPVGIFSSDDSRFKGEVEQYLKRLFPKKSIYEKY